MYIRFDTVVCRFAKRQHQALYGLSSGQHLEFYDTCRTFQDGDGLRVRGALQRALIDGEELIAELHSATPSSGAALKDGLNVDRQVAVRTSGPAHDREAQAVAVAAESHHAHLALLAATWQTQQVLETV